MIKVLTACVVVLLLVMHFSTQTDAQPNISNGTTPNPNGGGFMVLPSILSLILPAGLLTSLLHDLH